jgi:hypothetical protein
MHARHWRAPLSDSELVKESLRRGAYVGEVIRGIRPCRWAVSSSAGGEGSLPIVCADRSESLPVRWCYKRIKNGEEDNVWHKFTILVIKRDRPGAPEIAPEGGDPGPGEERPSGDPATSPPALPVPGTSADWPAATARPIPVEPPST